LSKFAAEGKLDDDINELYAKFVIARSVLDTFQDGDCSADILVLLEWAREMVTLYGDIEAAYEENLDFKNVRNHHLGTYLLICFVLLLFIGHLFSIIIQFFCPCVFLAEPYRGYFITLDVSCIFKKLLSSSSSSGGLFEWFMQLENTRRRVDDEQIAGNMLSDIEMRRMGELDRIAAMGTEDERLLHSLISRHDQVTKTFFDVLL
jgi:hypothetical protein